MATATKGRATNRSRSAFGGYSGWSWGTGSSYGRPAATTRGRKTTRRAGSGGTGYKSVCSTCEQKINSYKTIWNQAKGPATVNTPTPTTLNTFANWVNKGAVVQMCTPAQVSRWARAKNKSFNSSNPTPTSCKSVLTAKFGKSAIKAVCRTKGGFLVATTPTINGKTFNFPR